MKTLFDFELPDNACIKIVENSTLLIVTLCVPKYLEGAKNHKVAVERTPKRFVIRKRRVLVHLNSREITRNYFKMLTELKIEARELKKSYLTSEIYNLQTTLAI